MIRGTWLLIAAAVVAWIVALTSWTAADPRFSSSAYDAFSSYNTSPGGVSQAYAYLDATHHGARRLIHDLALDRPSPRATLFRIGASEPSMPTTLAREETPKRKEETKTNRRSKKREPETQPQKEVESLIGSADESWIRAGGRMVIVPSGSAGQIHLVSGPCSASQQVFPTEPPLPKIDVPSCHSLSGAGLQHFHSLLIDDSGPLLVRRSIGAGELLVFSIPEALSNEYLARGGNLALLDSLAGDGREIVFDETIHGIREESSIWDVLLGQWRLGPALFLFALAALGAFWKKAKTTGRADRPDADSRSEAIALVESLGQLYDRAVDRETSLRLYYQALLRSVHARTGMKGEALERFVRSRTEGYDTNPKFHDISREEFQRMLKILNRAYETVGHGNSR